MTLVRNLLDLRGRTALITGGSRGLGLQIAEALGSQGARIFLSARKADELQDACEHLARLGIEADWTAADNSREEEVARLVDVALQKMGHVDILVNNAGATWGAPAAEHPLSAWDKVMNVNLRSVFVLTQRIGNRSMIPNRQGRIINIGSIYGLKGNEPHEPPTLAYNAAKGAIVNFTRALACEWGAHNITVNAIAPGFFPTRMTRGTLADAGLDAVTHRVPLQRIGDDDDLKGAALLFASDAGKHITGQVLAVDGGMTAR